MKPSTFIDRFGKPVSRRRPQYGKTDSGGAKIVGELVTIITVYIQNGGGSTSSRYGGERDRYSHVGFCRAGTDVTSGDLLDWNGKTYRVESYEVPDEREITDPLSYIVLGLERDGGVS